MQSIPLAVLKQRLCRCQRFLGLKLHAIHTACGIETLETLDGIREGCTLHAIHTACGIETRLISRYLWI